MSAKHIVAAIGILCAVAGMAFGGNAYLIGSGVVIGNVAHFIPPN